MNSPQHDPSFHPEGSAENCLFCKIVADQVPASKVYEDDETLAFLDIAPNNPGHALVIPKSHFENVYSTPPEIWARVMLTAQKMAIAIKQAVDADGINIHVNNEAAANQLIMHSHVHVIPRHNDDGLPKWQGKPISAEDNAKVQEDLKRVLAE